ncbi:hypothetical protein QX204_10760 [Nocardia sp. PE-7]|uniref:hypothetical protein n=1 Tax=Nocardia sp. PE-7 TaxID=3058426 RepID=UPI002657D28E|nr:hypothetical protein [Nocardia sp. PE-7]WKG11908.1 hypothetical protein QX204_10760 [Nocardia sp. PE-7]
MRLRRNSVSALVTAVAMAAFGVSAATPVASGEVPGRTETVYSTSSPVTSVVASKVTLAVPLPPGSPHPQACDTLAYLRWRAVDGPRSSADAERVLVAQPGVFEGAGAFDSVARNTVALAADSGRYIEFWALDRRSNCLEDHTGVAAALRTGSFDTAADYYFGGAEADGRRFGGYAEGAATAWLRDQGLAQTLRDEYDVLRIEFPDQAVRKRKVLCGGHSLGGFVTGYFAEWDFDGNPATTDDAGYNQCSGYFALDTAIQAGLSLRGLQVPELPAPIAGSVEAASWQLDTALPVLRLPAVINPETTNLLALAGLAARLSPDGVNDLVRRLPDNPNVAATLRTLLSRDAAMFVTGQPDVRDLNATNEAVLGAILDDNSQPLGFLQASVGFPVGGPIGSKSFPLPDSIALSPLAMGMFGDAPKVSPTVYHPDTLYRWADYDDTAELTAPYTSPTSEVTAIGELARSLCEPPLDFTEWYFPTRLSLDLQQTTAPSFAGHHIHLDGVDRNPILTFRSSGGIPVADSGSPRDEVIHLPGYNHIDVLTAAARQNDGRPEVVSARLAAFATDPA